MLYSKTTEIKSNEVLIFHKGYASMYRIIRKKVPDRYKDHGKDEVFAQEWHHQTGGRNNLYHQEEENVKTNQDRYRQCHLR